MEKVVETFINQYELEYDYYENLSKIAHEICENELHAIGVKAITSGRAKQINSLRDKLLKRDNEKDYQTIEEIRDDICDLAGVRVALYFPSEKDVVDRIIKEKFKVISIKEFPIQSKETHYNKKFSGYGARHYRVKLKNEKKNKRYFMSIFEIQVASLLMHSWSEIEHDLVYKPLNGKLSKEEYDILDEINGLVLVGEVALERLKNSMQERVSKDRIIDDSYDLKNYISYFIDDINNKNIGNLNQLNSIMEILKYSNKSKLTNIIKDLNFYKDESITNEIIDKILIDKFKTDNDYKKYKDKIFNNDNRNGSGFEYFLKLWILFEKVTDYHHKYMGEDKNRIIGYKFDIYIKLEILNKDEIKTLNLIRKTRNELLHGNYIQDNEVLYSSGDALIPFVKKAIDKIEEGDVKEIFTQELNHITRDLE